MRRGTDEEVLVHRHVDGAGIELRRPVTDVLVFETPAARIKYLRLELPAAAVGGSETLRLQIPAAMIVER